MIDKKQRDILNENFDKLSESKKEKLLNIGEKLLDIQNVIDSEKLITKERDENTD